MDQTRITYPHKLVLNANVSRCSAYPDALRSCFDQDDFERALDVISRWPTYQPSPMRTLPGLARVLGIKQLFYKDESERFGLGSFKPLGGAYAVTRLLTRILHQRGEESVDPRDLLLGRHRDKISDITVTAATDGNHGRSVAWGAQQCGCRCVIYIHEHVTMQRELAIQNLGAEVVRMAGTYDDSVRRAYLSAQAPDWYIIQDTTDGEEAQNTLDVMHGYTLLAQESLQQIDSTHTPTHIFLQAGVGGMAAAVIAYLWNRFGNNTPLAILCEPETAACCFLSLQQGRLQTAPGTLETIMAGLACGEVSSLAWEVLQVGAYAALSLEDNSAADCMRLLADGRYADEPIVAGESAVAGLAGLIAACGEHSARHSLQLNQDSRVLVIGTEGATDPEFYQLITGRTAREVLNAHHQ